MAWHLTVVSYLPGGMAALVAPRSSVRLCRAGCRDDAAHSSSPTRSSTT